MMYKYCLFLNYTTYSTTFKYMIRCLFVIVSNCHQKEPERATRSLFMFLYLLTWLRRERDLESDKAWRRERLLLLNAPSTHDKA